MDYPRVACINFIFVLQRRSRHISSVPLPEMVRLFGQQHFGHEIFFTAVTVL